MMGKIFDKNKKEKKRRTEERKANIEIKKKEKRY